MCLSRFRTVLPVLLTLVGCGQPLEEPTRPSARDGQAGWGLSLLPSSNLDECEQVVSISLHNDGGDSATPLERLAFVEGQPSAVAIGRYQEGEITEALSQQLVPIEYQVKNGNVEIRPRGILTLGQSYSILSSLGVLGVVTTAPKTDRAYLARLWPRDDSAFGVKQVIYCGSHVPSEIAEIPLFPSGNMARVELGLDEADELRDKCIRIIPSATTSNRVLLPPPNIDSIAVEPTPFSTDNLPNTIMSADCFTGETSLGPGCLAIDGDRAIVRGPQAVTFWAISSILGRQFQVLEPGARFVVPELDRLSDSDVNVVVFDLAGRSTRDYVAIEKPTPAPRILINEVMANPLGPEPSEEWIELLNAGTATASLEGYRISDAGAETELPAFDLEPGQFVLLVRNDFVGGQSGDVPPMASTVMLRLDQLGKSGISNSGEALSLRDVEGKIVSQFPAKSSDRAGRSVARRFTTTLDDDSSGFVSHGGQGASPGVHNQTE